MRKNVKQMMMSRGLTSTEAEIVMDTVEHISKECIETVDRICASVPENLYIYTVTLATLMLEHRLNKINASMSSVLVSVAEEVSRG
jgi:hypothetical protein